ncbi:MAG: hypothetical protein K0Q73_7615 [Paenibacillus sp.]|nr:hypothetical protein [Paenibacillus sp.]
MNKKKLIVSAIAALMLVSSFTAGAYAATKFKLIVNGKASSADIREINGSTYVPLKDVAELLGAKVGFDNNTKTVTITSQGQSSPSQTSTPAAAAQNSRTKPAAIGSTIPFAVDSVVNKYSGQVTISQIIRGDEAWSMIQSTNQFNEAPKDGFEYLLAKAKVSITANNKAADGAVDIWSGDFTLVSAAGTDYDRLSVVLPDPGIDANIYAGSSKEGWVAFQVKKDDLSPVISYARKYDGTGGAWFKTN